MKQIANRITMIFAAALLILVSGLPVNAAAVAAGKTSKPAAQSLTFVLVHGAWVDAAFWDETAAALRKMGHTVYTPEYAGHGSDSKNTMVTHQQVTQSVVDFIKEKDLHDIILLGHSFGGTVVQKTAEQVPDRIRRLVFFDAFVLPDGQSVADQFPAPVQQLFSNLLQASGNNTIMLPFPLFRDVFVNTATLEQAQALYQKAIPEPAGPAYEKLDLKKFYSLDLPKSYLYLTEDTVLPQGASGWHPGQSSRLGTFRYIEGRGDHMTTVHTEPAAVAAKIVQAGRE
ncbi:salicylate esterase [Paenibacillus sp. FSL R7-0273]|uniref:alpha/beta hydrolase n=1 Tax=Paenibacillus sp. FSL R7-0273 TaxID=1536772 RepID=UPI0004F7A303|nr:alpha/beta hydrolase [Paenibacillus sp. FSL R7-0273]AIQ46668.1 salicylate esterase [Paenibacillus sp. FSL R7-0273]OMF97563.1 alpha/beta hydrolase [Paenibacillus sp. FSL R7-0273]